MARRIIVHIGPRKTATTYLQRALQSLVRSRDIDPSAYPIRTRGRIDHNQVPGLIDLARSQGEIGLQDDAWTQQDGSYARALLDAVAAAETDVILSAEAMSVLRPSGATAIVQALSPAPVDVVITARALHRVLPSSWQQHMRNGNFEAYDAYLALRAEERTARIYETELSRGFWRAYRYGDLVRRWQEAARSVSVVTVPVSSADPAETWRRFRAACAVDTLPIAPPDIPDDRANISLTGAETFAIFGLNLAARAAGRGRREVRAMHRTLLREGWTDRSDRGPRLGLPPALRPEVRAWADEDLDALRATGVAVYGSLDDLRCTADDADPGVPSADQVAAASGAALALLFDERSADHSDDD
ncbi:MAG: hypothetical protein KGN38_11790 [Actinomycetales bacterium]|nr:hypothetical protein [Actinomycetales bacterium]